MSETTAIPDDEKSDYRNKYNDISRGDRLSISEPFLVADNVIVTHIADVSTRERSQTVARRGPPRRSCGMSCRA